jgi:tetratricopeptide (TPR) repeat protein
VLTQELIDQALAKAVERYENGRLGEAVGICQKLLLISPTHTPSLRLLGTMALQTGHYGDAVDYIGRAAAGHPENADLCHLLSIAQLRLGHLPEATANARRALALGKDRNPAEMHCTLGVALAASGKRDDAAQQFAEALRHEPDRVDAHLNFAAILAERGQWPDAIAHYRAALLHDPGNTVARVDLACALAESGEPDMAAEEEREVQRLAAADPTARQGIGLALITAGRAAEAIAQFRGAVAAEPQSAHAHYGLALALLLLGNLKEGWREYEWRWELAVQKLYARPFRQPQWRGEDLTGRLVVLHAEQGLGDSIHFCRYVPLVAERSAGVCLEAPFELVRLLQLSFAGQKISVRPRMASFPGVGDLPAADFHCPLLSLPDVFGTSLETIPATIPYLRPDPAQAAAWARRFAGLPHPRVGLIWGGRPNNAHDRLRSIALARLAPLAAVAGVSFVSLQKGEAAAQAAAPPPGMALHDVAGDLQDFADTAAAISALDLVITVDTAVAHLAGAMGQRVWVMNRRYTDWRWLLEREDSPWYPSLRLFRQPHHGDWDTVIARVATALQAFADAIRLGHDRANSSSSSAPYPPP